MQYYTKQQLQGASRYNPRCRVGNWNEDMEADEVKLREFIKLKDAGGLMMDAHSVRMRNSLSPVELTTIAQDENVHIGDMIQLASGHMTAALACDIEEKDPRVHRQAVAASCSQLTNPCSRNTFILEKFVTPASHKATFVPQYGDNVLHYGQQVTIRVNPAVQSGSDDDRPMYVTSEIMSISSFSKVTHHQEVYITPKTSFNNVWKVLPPSSDDRDIAEGTPVMAGAPVFITHCATGSDLACLGAIVKNDFGDEYEVCSHTAASLGKQWKLGKDKTGHHKAQVDVAGGSPNCFRIITGNV